jgi:hypothetical protein
MSMKWAKIPEGVVHPHIDRPEFRLDVLGCGRHLGVVGNVQWQASARSPSDFTSCGHHQTLTAACGQS